VEQPQVATLPWKWLMDWRWLTLIGLGVTASLTTFSIAFLFKLPTVPNCPAVFWPLASGSLRLHCAQIAANKQTVKDLLEGIRLLNTLGQDHPLYPEASRLIEQWSSDILDLAEAEFQAGRIQEAIAAARQIPSNSAAHQVVDQRITQWESVWAKAEKIFEIAIDILKQGNWRDAQTQSARLLSIDNTFWQTTKYQELSNLVVATRDDINKLGKAERALDYGGADDLVASIQEVAGIQASSFVHDKAQSLIPKLGHKMLDLAREALDRRDSNAALEIVNRIPVITKLQPEIDDFRILAQAQSQAWEGGVLNLEDAIATAKRIQTNRPAYAQAQSLIARWHLQIKDATQIAQAEKLAQAGDLREAIAEASAIPLSNPLGQDARDFVEKTQSEIETQEDEPILDQAGQLAAQGDIDSLQTAIAQAQAIAPGRALYDQAQRRIRQWSDQLKTLQKTQFPPLDSPEASFDPDLSDTNSIRLQAEQALQQARTTAEPGTPDALSAAISLAQTVPSASSLQMEATMAIAQWSEQMLQMAREQASADLSGALAIAEKVPPGSSAYLDARQQISQWRRLLGR
jgi:hypothetical protein